MLESRMRPLNKTHRLRKLDQVPHVHELNASDAAVEGQSIGDVGRIARVAQRARLYAKDAAQVEFVVEGVEGLLRVSGHLG